MYLNIFKFILYFKVRAGEIRKNPVGYQTFLNREPINFLTLALLFFLNYTVRKIVNYMSILIFKLHKSIHF
jgi:hypothetical protein